MKYVCVISEEERRKRAKVEAVAWAIAGLFLMGLGYMIF